MPYLYEKYHFADGMTLKRFYISKATLCAFLFFSSFHLLLLYELNFSLFLFFIFCFSYTSTRQSRTLRQVLLHVSVCNTRQIAKNNTEKLAERPMKRNDFQKYRKNQNKQKRRRRRLDDGGLHFTEYFSRSLLLYLSIFILLNSDDFKHLLLLLMLLLLILSFSSILIGKHYTHAYSCRE